RHTTVSMTNSTDRVEIITSVQRRRRWTAPEKVRMVEETFEAGMTGNLVAPRPWVAPNQLFTLRRLVAQGSLTVSGRSGATTKITICVYPKAKDHGSSIANQGRASQQKRPFQTRKRGAKSQRI